MNETTANTPKLIAAAIKPKALKEANVCHIPITPVTNKPSNASPGMDVSDSLSFFILL